MKKVALAAFFAAVASTAAYAGTIEPVFIEPEVIVEEAASSSSAGLVVLLLLVAIVAAVSTS